MILQGKLKPTNCDIHNCKTSRLSFIAFFLSPSNIYPWHTHTPIYNPLVILTQHNLLSAAVLGNGVYFAVDASYSAKPTYSPLDLATGMRYMYLARVLVGDYTVGKEGLLVPPNKHNPTDPTDAFDTVVDQEPNPKIFVTFYDWQCYPEYLITFQ